MIGRGEITKAAQSNGVDAQTAERDYVLAHVAVDIAGLGQERFVLKGGTCLRLGHYHDYRYSADLDYSIRDLTITDAYEVIDAALDRCRTRVGFPVLRLERDADPVHIVYVGPLASKPRTIKIDLVTNELVIETAPLGLVVRWRDMPDAANLTGYTLTEICAEKLRCVIQRRQCRDVYDLWSLLDDRGGADLFDAWHRFERKAAHRSLDPKRFFDRWNTGLDWYRTRWQPEMVDYLGASTPDFNHTAKTLERHITTLRNYLG